MKVIAKFAPKIPHAPVLFVRAYERTLPNTEYEVTVTITPKNGSRGRYFLAGHAWALVSAHGVDNFRVSERESGRRSPAGAGAAMAHETPTGSEAGDRGVWP